jgi:hypothetical protein
LVCIESDPTPVPAARGTLLLTAVYHTTRKRSLRGSVELAAARVQVVAVPASEPGNLVVKRA